ncbi:glycosyltransferase family 4 protein [Mycolicibacterium iranicum]|uniref:glycosyltransferase family 4 protein n=1 Tax=Mycolicibacterium iranicum TaxID=912594 RepID=UPI000466F645|nr:glycosyltransferase family 4 protein [Mycolicibacterium iranicum]
MPGRRISILSLHYSPDATGIAPYAGAFATGLSAQGHQVTAHVAHPFYPEWKIRNGYGQWKTIEELDGVAVRRYRHYVPNPPRGLRRLLSEISFGARLFFSKLDKKSVVFAVSPALFATAAVALRLRLTPRRPPLVVWVQDLYTLGLAETGEGSGLASTVMKFVEKQTLRAADRVVVIHPRFGEYVENELGIKPDRITIVRNWTHLKSGEEIAKEDARKALGWTVDTVLAIHTGNMGVKQGLENIVEAARLADAQKANIKFLLVGDGGERARLAELAEGVERIEFVGQLNDAAYRLALAAADSLIVNELPGVAAMAVPSKLTSYFDAGRPVIAATDLGGITAGEVRDANAGVVVSAGDPEALLAAALRLSDDPRLAAAYGSAGRSYRTAVLSQDAAIAAFEQIAQEMAEG